MTIFNGDNDLSAGDIPIIGGWLGESRADKAAKQKQNMMGEAAQDYASYRPIQTQQRMNALNNLSGLFAPVNNALGQMYGQGAMFDMGQLNKSPIIEQNLWPGSGPYRDPDSGIPAWQQREIDAQFAKTHQGKLIDNGGGFSYRDKPAALTPEEVQWGQNTLGLNPNGTAYKPQQQPEQMRSVPRGNR